MGKSNRIRTKKANATLAGVAPKKQKNEGMPSWALNLITIAVTVVILLTAVLSVMSSNGVFMRAQTAMKTENFKVNGQMMSYFFQMQYESFLSENQSMISYMGIDTGKSLKDQLVNSTDASQGTWFDSIMATTKEQVKELLVFCEEANKRGIELDEEDIAGIEAEIQMYEIYAQIYGYTTNSYIASMFGKGMKAKDIRNCLEISTLATKCSDAIVEELEGLITDDRINAEFDKNKLDYMLVDISGYTIEVAFDDACEAVLGKAEFTNDDIEAKKADIFAKYKEMIAEARAEAAEIAKLKTIEEFNDYIITNIIEKTYDEEYNGEIADNDKLTSDKLPSAENIATLRAKALEHLKDLVKNEKEFSSLTVKKDDKITVFDIEVSEEFASFFDHIIEHALTDINKEKAECILEGTNYDDTDEVLEWAFEDGRVAGDIKTLEDGDTADNAELSDNISKLNQFEITVYYLAKTQYKDEELTKDLGIMIFGTEADAKAAIENLTAGITLETFESVCEELKGSYTDYENYVKGTITATAFDAWVYSEEAVKGAYTKTPIKLDDSSYAVVLYADDGEPGWKVSVEASILKDDFEARKVELTNACAVTTKDKVLNRVDG